MSITYLHLCIQIDISWSLQFFLTLAINVSLLTINMKELSIGFTILTGIQITFSQRLLRGLSSDYVSLRV